MVAFQATGTAQGGRAGLWLCLAMLAAACANDETSQRGSKLDGKDGGADAAERSTGAGGSTGGSPGTGGRAAGGSGGVESGGASTGGAPIRDGGSDDARLGTPESGDSGAEANDTDAADGSGCVPGADFPVGTYRLQTYDTSETEYDSDYPEPGDKTDDCSLTAGSHVLSIARLPGGGPSDYEMKFDDLLGFGCNDYADTGVADHGDTVAVQGWAICDDPSPEIDLTIDKRTGIITKFAFSAQHTGPSDHMFATSTGTGWLACSSTGTEPPVGVPAPIAPIYKGTACYTNTVVPVGCYYASGTPLPKPCDVDGGSWGCTCIPDSVNDPGELCCPN